jgi:hypothetical protein
MEESLSFREFLEAMAGTWRDEATLRMFGYLILVLAVLWFIRSLVRYFKGSPKVYSPKEIQEMREKARRDL